MEFRIVLDGRPLSTTPVEANLGFDYGGVRTRSATTTVEGLMYLERDLFLDPPSRAQPGSVPTASTKPMTKNAKKIGSVRVRI